MRHRSRFAAAVLLAAGSGCGRVHDLDEGTYALVFTAADVIRDDCGLVSSGAVAVQLQFTTFGNMVRLAYYQQNAGQCMAVELFGQYLLQTQQFFADGTASNQIVEVGGQECQLDFVNIHIDAVTVDSSRFEGALSVTLTPTLPDVCLCSFWVNYQAAQCVPPACPPIPPGCPN